MKILHTVKLYSPRSGGMYEVVKQLSERLASRGNFVTIATLPLLEEDRKHIHPLLKVVEFNIKGSYTKGFSGETEKYKNFAKNEKFDIITNFAAQQPMTDVLLPELPVIKAKKVFVPTGFNGLYLKNLRKYFQQMPNWMRQYDANVIISKEQRDMYFAQKNNIPNVSIISNGASEEEFNQPINFSIREKLFIPKDNILVFHVGSHTGYKGHSQAIEIFAQANIKSATLLIVGNICPNGCFENCTKLASKYNQSKNFNKNKKNIIIEHLSRIETLVAYKESNIFLFPSNIEGGAPIVLFESMASSIPFLTTDVGNTREIVDQTGGGIILPTKKNVPPENNLVNTAKHVIKMMLEFFDIGNFHSDRGFVRADIADSTAILEKLCSDKNLREKLGIAGHKAWLNNFTWEKIATKYEKLYLKLINYDNN